MREVIIHEVGMRDGLQMEDKVVPTDIKIKWIEILLESKLDIIQIGSFVNPQKMPQMADTDELFNHFKESGKKPDRVTFSALILNEKGLERGMKCGVDMFCMGISASETHSMKNTGMNTQEARKRIINIALEAQKAGKKVQTSVQCAFGCGFGETIDEDQVLGIVKDYLNAGINNISLADTAGLAQPEQVKRLYNAIFELKPDAELACHFHNTQGMGLVNSLTALNCGVKYFETAFAGLGGCPFTNNPVGNIATEAFVHSIHAKGLRKDVSLEHLKGMTKIVNYYLNRELSAFMF